MLNARRIATHGLGFKLSPISIAVQGLTPDQQTQTVARPVADVLRGAWLPSSGVTLASMIDEVTPDDTDFIYTTQASKCELALNATAYPGGSNQVFSFRADSPTESVVVVTLKQGSTVVASWEQVLTPMPTTYAHTLTAAEIAMIGPGALALELEAA